MESYTDREEVSSSVRSKQSAAPVTEWFRFLACGAAWGTTAWVGYGVIEYLVCSVWPLFTAHNAFLTAQHWNFSAWLFNVYWIVGAVAGAICAAAIWYVPAPAGSGSDPRPRVAGTVSLYAGLLVAALSGPSLHPSARTFLVADVFLLAAAFWTWLRPASRLTPWLHFTPVTAALLILGPSWISVDVIETGIFKRRATMMLAAAATIAVTRLLNRFADWTPTRHMVSSVAALAMAVVVSSAWSGMSRAIPDIPAAHAADPGAAPVIMISLDTTRADHMSAYGYSRPTTPNLEAFARNATLYTDAVAASDWTLPSHASIFTGLYTGWHGARAVSIEPVVLQPLRDSHSTLAGILRRHGFLTAAAVANHAFLLPEWGLSAGFESFNVHTPVQILPYLHTYYFRAGLVRLLSCCTETMGFEAYYRSGVEINTDAIGTLELPQARGR